MKPCIFCDIVKGSSPASVIYEDADVLALLDTNPVQRGHSLVIPKKHYVDIWDIDSEVLVKVVKVTKRVAQRMREVWDSEGVNIFGANGKPAGQDIYHFHMHVIPLGKGQRTKFVDWWLSAMGKAERAELESWPRNSDSSNRGPMNSMHSPYGLPTNPNIDLVDQIRNAP